MRRLKSSLLSTCVFVAATAASFSAHAAASYADNSGPTMHAQAPAAPDAGPSPYQLKLQYTGEAWDNSGGLKDGTLYMQNVDAQLMVNTEKAFGWTGGRFLVDGFWNSSRSADTQYVNPIQDPSVIDTAGQTMFRLYQAYYDQNFKSTGTDLLLGVYDVETEFGNTKPMNLFFNGGYAWTTTLDQAGINGPSNYPNTSLAFRARQDINDQWSVQGVIADGESDSVKRPGINAFEFQRKYGAMLVGEVDYQPSKHTKIMAGYWDFTGKFDKQDGGQTYNSDGFYVGGATRLYEEKGWQGLDGFINVGLADATVNEVDRTVNMGLTYTGPFDARPRDKVGLAMSIAGVGDPYRKAQLANGDPVSHYETNFEATYRAPINSWLTVQPDVQYWINPGVNPNQKNDWLVGVHFEIGHLFDL